MKPNTKDLSYYRNTQAYPKCKQGHEINPNNRYSYTLKGTTYHKCRTCAIEYERNRRARGTNLKEHDEELCMTHEQLMHKLESAMPWEKEHIKQQMKNLFLKAHN
jgi:hypothetical protein